MLVPSGGLKSLPVHSLNRIRKDSFKESFRDEIDLDFDALIVFE